MSARSSLAAVLSTLAVAVPGQPPAGDAGSPTPLPAQTVDGPLTLPVLDIAGPVQDIVTFNGSQVTGQVDGLSFPEASPDGAVEMSGGGRVFRLSSDVLFPFDSADLTERAAVELGGIATRLRDEGVSEITVLGYTDDQGSDDYNLHLSQRRAAMVQKALSDALGGLGVNITATGLGEADPIANNGTPEGQSLNRRVTITAK
jgi:outer membrane protein OmpA-like peptidoglycan-associated protein